MRQMSNGRFRQLMKIDCVGCANSAIGLKVGMDAMRETQTAELLEQQIPLPQ